MTLFELATLLDVEHNYAFCPRGGDTFCNDYAAVFCAARGARLPPLKANDQYTWLQSPNGSEWLRIGKSEAVTRANASQTVVAIVQAIPHGHVAPLVESPPEDPAGAYVSAAGAHNYVRCELSRSFGPMQPVFYVHSKE